MNIPKQIILCTLGIVLAMAVMSQARRAAALQCQYVWRYAISYGGLHAQSAAHAILLDAIFPVLPPLCLDIWHLPGHSA